MTWCLPLWLHNLKSILCQLFQAQKKHHTWTHRKLSPRFKTQTWFSPARGLSYLRPPQTSEKLELLPKFIINAHLYFAGIVSCQKFWVYEQRHTFLKLMLILWSQPSDFFCTHLVMGESHTFADAASHHLPHWCISCRCVRERKPSLADPRAWSAAHFNSPSYVSVNSTPKMETWESCFLTATLNEQKSYESGMHTLGLPQWPPLCSCPPEQGDVWAKLHPYRDDHVVLPSPLPTNSHMTSDPSFPPAVLFVISFWVWVSVRRTSPLVLPRGQTFLSFMQAKFSCCIHELRQTGKPYEEGPGWFLSH